MYIARSVFASDYLIPTSFNVELGDMYPATEFSNTIVESRMLLNWPLRPNSTISLKIQ